MGTYLLTWNPTKHFCRDNLEECIESQKSIGHYDCDWSCGVTKKIVRGDRIFLMRLGDENSGIVASGKVKPYSHCDKSVKPVQSGSDVFQAHKWQDQSDPSNHHKTALYVNVRWKRLLNPERDIFPLSKLEELNEGFTEEEQQKTWTPMASGITIKPKVATRLEAQWREFLSSLEPAT